MKSHKTLKSLIERNRALTTNRTFFQPRHQPFHQSAAPLRRFPCRLSYLAQQPSHSARNISSSVSSRPSIPNPSGPLSSSEPSEEPTALPAPNLSDRASRSPSGGLASISTPAYELSITCKPKPPLPDCGHRSTHRISKQGYFNGTILVQCPKCGNRHLIADHLKIFSDKSVTLEDIMRENGKMVKKGMIAANGDVEFWDDPTTARKDAEVEKAI